MTPEALGGLVLIYAAFFLYENEQGNVQSVLEDLWLRIEEHKEIFLSRHAAFMREVARLTNVGFDRLFGKKLFSWQSFAVSSCYSIGSVCLVLAYRVWSYDLMLAAARRTTPVVTKNSIQTARLPPTVQFTSAVFLDAHRVLP